MCYLFLKNLNLLSGFPVVQYVPEWRSAINIALQERFITGPDFDSGVGFYLLTYHN